MYDNAQALREAASKIEERIKTELELAINEYVSSTTFTDARKEVGQLIKYLSYKLESRIKSEDEIERKFLKNSNKWKNISNVPDVLGFRISFQIDPEKRFELQTLLDQKVNPDDYVCTMICNDLAMYIRCLVRNEGERLLADDGSFDSYDYMKTPKKSGYKGNNIWYRVNGLGVEIQVMSEEMKRWVEETHEEYKEAKYSV